MFLEANNLKQIKQIKHGFFTRGNGVSKGIYALLNCGIGSLDEKNNVIKNRKLVAKKIGFSAENFAFLYQSHSNDVVVVEKLWRHSKMPKADAMVTKQSGIALGILTADCVPVLFADAKNNVIGAAHAGWQGAFSGIVQNTIQAMIKIGAEIENISCAIGPAIAQKSYQVGIDFKQKFIAQNENNEQYFISSKDIEHFMFDLKKFVFDSAQNSGIKNIDMLDNDTYTEEDNFFSYRRATHKKEPDYGRQVSVIVLP